jgi:superfamily I DNA/RNA helicase
MTWYSRVSKDIAHLPDCLDYFYNELTSAKAEVKIHGVVERASASLPGIVEHRFNQLQEIEAILEYLGIELRRIRSKAFRKYLENYQRALSSRDCEKYVEGEADVVDMEKIINEFALLRNQWLGIIKGLDIKQWQLSNIIKLRAAGLEDITL